MPKKATKAKKDPNKEISLVRVDFQVSHERDFKRYLKYLSHPGHIMARNFLAGTFHALGIIVGSAVLLFLIGFIFGDVIAKIPVFSEFGENAKIWLEQTKETE